MAFAEADTGSDAPEKPRPPLSLRPSRRPLLWVLPAVAMGATGVMTLFDQANVGVLNAELAVVTVTLAFQALKLLCGWTKVDADGIHNYLFLRKATFPWQDVKSLQVTGTPFGRITVVVLRSGKRFHLAAPRSGLLGVDHEFDTTVDAIAAHAAASQHVPVDREMARTVRVVLWTAMIAALLIGVGLWRPWLSPWWPGRTEASSLPDACAVADTDTARRLVPDFLDVDRDHLNRFYLTTSRCEYTAGGMPTLEFELQLRRRTTTSSGTGESRAGYASAKDLATDIAGQGSPRDRQVAQGDVPGLGDRAWRIVEVDTREGDVDVRLLVLRGNVIVDVHYEARRPRKEVRDAADALARRALAMIDFH